MTFMNTITKIKIDDNSVLVLYVKYFWFAKMSTSNYKLFVKLAVSRSLHSEFSINLSPSQSRIIQCLRIYVPSPIHHIIKVMFQTSYFPCLIFISYSERFIVHISIPKSLSSGEPILIFPIHHSVTS